MKINKNIIAISLKGKSTIADMIIASGSSSRHLQSCQKSYYQKVKNGIIIK